jgi:hypothetical protein
LKTIVLALILWVLLAIPALAQRPVNGIREAKGYYYDPLSGRTVVHRQLVCVPSGQPVVRGYNGRLACR